MREQPIEQYFTKLVRLYGGIAYKWVSPGNTGVPDRIVIFHGIVHFVELKATKGVLRYAQKYQARRLSKLGFDVQVIRSKKQAKAWVEINSSVASLLAYPRKHATITGISEPTNY